MRRSLLITGGAGFIGTNFVYHWVNCYPDDRVIVLDALTYAGNRQNLATLEDSNQIVFVHGDIGDRSLVNQLLTTYEITTVINFAAESHVDRSIHAPDQFIQTNVIGTFTLLEAFRGYLTDKQSSHYRFLQVSTDEVYGSLNDTDAEFTETTPFAPNSPYSASKASADHFVRAYYKTYGLPTIVTHCSNNYGPYQFPEKLIPLMCVNILQGKPLPIYGAGQNIRDWIYVTDHCKGLAAVIERGRVGETYNMGGGNEIRNLDLVKQICDLMDHHAIDLPICPSQQLMQFVTDRPGHDWRYAIDNHKITTELGWQPEETIGSGLEKTIRWYLENQAWWVSLN
jgi:dTDP-glucose 4,6-dehydratase